MSLVREWLIKNFVLGTWVKIDGTLFHTLRAPRVLVPLITFVGLIIVSDPMYPMIQWWDILLLLLLFTGFYFGFSFFKWSYFTMYPPRYDEMDDEQKHDFLRAIRAGKVKNPEQGDKYGYLTEPQLDDYLRLTMELEEKHQGRFSGLQNLIPTAVSILVIIIWAIWIMPNFI